MSFEKNTKFSVLMSVYFKDNPDWLKESISSILSNSIVPNQIVIVKDGQLNPELDSVLNGFASNPIFSIVGYETNLGLGRALDYGLTFCKFDLVARMDSDDICKPTRFETQLAVFDNNHSLSIVGSNIDEFIGEPTNVISVRVVPKDNKNIIIFSKKRNPFNHPSVMFVKGAVESVGGYKSLFRHEDYYLWYRMLRNGCLGENIQESLVYMRINNDYYKRRGGFRTFKGRMKLNKIMLKEKHISFWTFLSVAFVNFVNMIIPPRLRGFLHKKLLRKQKS